MKQLTHDLLYLLSFTLSVTAFVIRDKPGYVYETCELVDELVNIHNMSREEADTWTCIVKHESNFNTAAVKFINADNSGDYGLFQINDNFWCSKNDSAVDASGCQMSCDKLLDEDLADDVACARRVFYGIATLLGDGYRAWPAYLRYCYASSRSYVNECGIEMSSGIDRQLQETEADTLECCVVEATLEFNKSNQTTREVFPPKTENEEKSTNQEEETSLEAGDPRSNNSDEFIFDDNENETDDDIGKSNKGKINSPQIE